MPAFIPAHLKHLTGAQIRKLDEHADRLGELLDELKANPCTDCGGKFPPWVMQFDHLPQHKKSFEISQYTSLLPSREVLLAEIAKCELVCANCHAMRTHDRREVKKEADLMKRRAHALGVHRAAASDT